MCWQGQLARRLRKPVLVGGDLGDEMVMKAACLSPAGTHLLKWVLGLQILQLDWHQEVPGGCSL